MPQQSSFASPSLSRHLARGAIGFGLIGSAIGLTPSVGPEMLLLAPLGMVALRGCPMCWTLGLVETISAGRLRRSCEDGSCRLRPIAAAPRPPGHPETPRPSGTPTR
jgi:hypothetical protein